MDKNSNDVKLWEFFNQVNDWQNEGETNVD